MADIEHNEESWVPPFDLGYFISKVAESPIHHTHQIGVTMTDEGKTRVTLTVKGNNGAFYSLASKEFTRQSEHIDEILVEGFIKQIKDLVIATTKINPTSRQPHLATLLLCLFLSAADRDNIIGDLDEKFPKWIERHGVRMARFLYLKDACTTIYPAAQKLWWRIFKLLAKVGGIAGIVEIIRQIRFW